MLYYHKLNEPEPRIEYRISNNEYRMSKCRGKGMFFWNTDNFSIHHFLFNIQPFLPKTHGISRARD